MSCVSSVNHPGVSQGTELKDVVCLQLPKYNNLLEQNLPKLNESWSDHGNISQNSINLLIEL